MTAVKLAYLTNQYPKPSHTFIRREIAGVEAAGVDVERISIRPPEELVDERDLAEALRTRVILERGALGLLPSACLAFVTRPARTLRAVATAVALGWRSPRGVGRHLAYLAEAAVLLRWLREHGVEHLHVHFATNPTAVALLCRELGGPPFSFTVHGNADFSATTIGSLPRKIRDASFVVAVSENGRARLRECAPVGHEHKLRVVHCGIDAQFLAGAATAVPDVPRLACVARLSPEKGIDVLLRAAALLSERGVDFEIALLGDGPERAKLERAAVELGLSDRVCFEGWRSGDEVRERLLDSRALVLASLSEGLPVVIMEALALHRPVICTAVGGVAELVTPGSSGWLVAPGSERELADAMQQALSRPVEELERMARAGARRVVAAHDSRVQARTMAELFIASSAAPLAAARPAIP